MSWSGQRVLVTGAGGFIGSHLAERLAIEGATTRALVRYTSSGSFGWLERSAAASDIEVIMGDIRDASTVASAATGVDAIFHLAALIAIPYSYEAPMSYVRTNVEGTLNVLEAAVRHDAMVVHTSTSEVYGTAQQVPINENHPLKAQSPYAASKISADKLAESFYLSYGLPVVTIRPFNTFGPRQSARAIIPNIIAQALTQPELRLGNLEPTRDLNYVADTVEGFVLAGGRSEAAGQVLNIGSGSEVSIGDLATRILALLGKSMPVVCEEARVRPAGSEVDRLVCDSTRARTLLGWRPATSLDDGLIKTADWVAANLGRFKPDRYAI